MGWDAFAIILGAALILMALLFLAGTLRMAESRRNRRQRTAGKETNISIPKISVAIPFHGDRWPYVRNTVAALANDPRVAEFVIVDDCSSPEDYKKLTDGIEAIRDHVGFPIRAHRNQSNLFIFRNKRRAIELSSSEWVCLLDSDNGIGGDYLDAWENAFTPDPFVVYLPEAARPSYDFSEYSGQTFNAANIGEHMASPVIRLMLNTGNYVVNRHTYLNATSACADDPMDPLASDVIYTNYILLRHGGKLLVVPGMQYDHLVHDGSSWKLHAHGSVEVADQLFTLYAELSR